MTLVTCLDFPFESPPPFKQGKSVCSDWLGYPIIRCYHVKIFSLFEKALPEGFHFRFSQEAEWYGLCLPPSSWAVQWADWPGGVEIYNVGKEQKVWGTTCSPGRECISQSWECFLGNFSNLGYSFGGFFSPHGSRCPFFEGLFHNWEAAGSFSETPENVFITIWGELW